MEKYLVRYMAAGLELVVTLIIEAPSQGVILREIRDQFDEGLENFVIFGKDAIPPESYEEVAVELLSDWIKDTEEKGDIFCVM